MLNENVEAYSVNQLEGNTVYYIMYHLQMWK